MTKKQRAEHIRRRLEERFPDTPIPLDHRDAYTLLVAVLLSAQCTDKRVNQVTPQLFALADNPQAMARQSVEAVEAIVRPCGLGPAKARHIVSLSKIIMERHGGKVPASLEELEALPGVGHKTASVIMVQWYGQPAFPVDTHIHRLARVWKLSAGRNVSETERDLKKLYPPECWGGLHLRFIFHGREVCPARGCDGRRCDLCQELFSQ